MRIGICDDEPYIRKKLLEICKEFSQSRKIHLELEEYTDGDEVVQGSERLDLLFLDIEMTRSNGIDTMHKLLENEAVWRIVFVSSHEEMIMDVFGVKTLAFVRKPFEAKDIEKWLTVVFREIENDFIIDLEEIKEKTFLNASSIIYLESKGNYSEVVTKEERYLTRRTMHKWEDILKNGDFLRIHKSYIINMEYIKSIGNDVILKDGSSFNVGRSYKKTTLDDYNNYVLKKMRSRR